MSAPVSPRSRFRHRWLPPALLLPAVLGTAAPRTGRADDTAPAYQLGEVVVTAHKPVVESTETVREVTARQIEREGARTLDEALALMPGVDVRVGGKGTPRVDVRGLRTRHVKLLVNGIPFNSAADGQFDPTLIPTEQIAKIKMTMGGGSELYGDGALGAVINIVTKQGAGKPHGSLTTEMGDGGERRIVGTFSVGNGKAGLFISASHLQSRGWPMSGAFKPTSEENGGLRSNSDRRRENFYVNGTYSFGPDWQLGFSFNHVEGDHGVPSTVINNPNDPFAMNPHYDRVDDEGAYYAQIDALYAPDGPWSNHAWAYVSTQHTLTNRYPDGTYTNLDDPSVMNTFHDNATSWNIGLHEQLSYAFQHFGKLALMVDFRHERLIQECKIRDIPISLNVQSNTSGTPQSYTLNFTDLTTNNNTGAVGTTSSSGGNSPVATLVMTDRTGGGIDLSLTDLASNNFGTNGYISRLFLVTNPGVNLSGIGVVAGAGSQASFGPVNVYVPPASTPPPPTIDGYPYYLELNFQKPGGAGDPLLQGETALWSFNKGSVADFVSSAATSASFPGITANGALVIRGVDTGSWFTPTTGAITGELGGHGQDSVARVAVQATQAVASGGSASVTPGGSSTSNLGCGGGNGSGGGLGLGGGTGQVVRVQGATFGLRNVDSDKSIDVLSVAAEYSIRPTDAIGLVFGYGAHWQARAGGTLQVDTSYNAGIYYDATRSTKLRASVSRKIRVPTVSQLYNQQFGNRNLAFERAQIYEAGVTQQLEHLGSVDVAGFYQDVSGLIQLDAATNVYQNVAKSTYHGFEVTADTHPLTSLDLRLGYSYLITRDRSPGTERKQIQYTPSHKFTVGTDYDFGHGLLGHASFVYIADQFYYARGGVTPLLKGKLPDYQVVNLKFDYHPFNQKRVGFFIGADNLLDENYEQAYGLPQAGRYLYGGVKLSMP